MAAAVVYLQFPAPAPPVVDAPPQAVLTPLPPPAAAIAPAQETAPAFSAPPKPAPAEPVTQNPSEAVFTHYTTEPGFVSRAVVRIDGTVVQSRNLFRDKKSDGGADIRAMPPTHCTDSFRSLAGGKPIFKDAITAALPAARRRYSIDVRWYDADGDELSRDAFDVDGKKALMRHTEFRGTKVPMLTDHRIGNAVVESAEVKMANANSMDGSWNVPKRPSWQPELPQQSSFFAP
ncbi:MAG: hypothetical protein M0D55_20470 [Elusimicrobiota bacterium]|nr:MAG: hypothetical protein M0D55_20470 [Elusimicrobiota bacterium]